MIYSELKAGDCVITEGDPNTVYYVTNVDTSNGRVSKLCISPSSESFGMRDPDMHLVQVACGYLKIEYNTDTMDTYKVVRKYVGRTLYRPVFYDKLRIVKHIEAATVIQGSHSDGSPAEFTLCGQNGIMKISRPELFNDRYQPMDNDIFGYWVDSKGYRIASFTLSGIQCEINPKELEGYEYVRVNLQVRKINDINGSLKKVRVCAPNGIILKDDTFIPNDKLSEYITSEGKRLIRESKHRRM